MMTISSIFAKLVPTNLPDCYQSAAVLITRIRHKRRALLGIGDCDAAADLKDYGHASSVHDVTVIDLKGEHDTDS